MGFGDSITEGGDGFETYLYPLWERLFAAGYEFDFVGPHESECRIGKLANCGFRGKNVEFLESITDSVYAKYKADYVLIHAGHNHFAEEKPVPGIIRSYRSIISKMLAINPKVIILLATVTESGKLPKYSYIPTLNNEIKKLVKEMHHCQVKLVDMNATHDWRTMTIADKVHPNTLGRERMAKVWFDALKPLLKKAPWKFKVQRVGYKAISGRDSLQAHIFIPKSRKTHTAVAWFFAGGWKYGSPLQFYRECQHFAKKGMVAVSFDYRIAQKDHASQQDAVEDCKDAVRWLRDHARDFDIDERKIAVGGASAGGSMAALLGCIDQDSADSLSRPDLLLLEYPTLHLSENKLKSHMPPMIMFMGTKDEFTSIENANEYVRRVKSLDNTCEFYPFEDRHHPIFYYRKPLTPDYGKMEVLLSNFLKKYKFIR